jgi:hypothetical protein
MIDQEGVPNATCLACGRVVACIRVAPDKVLRPLAWIYPDESRPLLGVCGRHVADVPKPGDEIWTQTTEGGPHDPWLRVVDVYQVGKVYDDGTFDIEIRRTVTQRPYVTDLDIDIGLDGASAKPRN